MSLRIYQAEETLWAMSASGLTSLINTFKIMQRNKL